MREGESYELKMVDQTDGARVWRELWNHHTHPGFHPSRLTVTGNEHIKSLSFKPLLVRSLIHVS